MYVYICMYVCISVYIYENHISKKNLMKHNHDFYLIF